MSTSLRFTLPAGLLLLCLLRPVAAAPQREDEWKPVTPTELALKAPVVEKDADAEVLFWEVRVKPEGEGAVLSHYLRIKVFTERGRETQSSVRFVYPEKQWVRDIAGRTITPAGKIIEPGRDAIFEKTAVSAKKLKIKSTTFLLPGVEAGAIIEYRWRELQKEFPLTLEFQRDIPMQRVSYVLPSLYRTRRFNLMEIYSQAEDKDHLRLTLTNVPAFRAEPFMPPASSVRRYLIAWESRWDMLSWLDFARALFEANKSRTKVNDEIRRAAANIIGAATEPEQKLRRIFDFCRTKIRNVSDESAPLTEAELANYKENKSSEDTLKRAIGTGQDINLLFIALAQAAGFDARYAILADRTMINFIPDQMDFFYMSLHDVAVRVGDQWKFYDPGSRNIPFGMLRWQEEDQMALLVTENNYHFVRTPLTTGERSLKKRRAQLKLLPDGTIEGTVRCEYTGHPAITLRSEENGLTAEQREQQWRDQLKRRLSTAELSDFHFENAQDAAQPLIYNYRVRVTGYAQRTGKRLFLQPAFFQKGVEAVFPTSVRHNDIYFYYPWQEDDEVRIELPDGYRTDQAEEPASFIIGAESAGMGRYLVSLQAAPDGKSIIYSRKFIFNLMTVRARNYSQIKAVFDLLHERDNHLISLKLMESAATPPRSQP